MMMLRSRYQDHLKWIAGGKNAAKEAGEEYKAVGLQPVWVLSMLREMEQ